MSATTLTSREFNQDVGLAKRAAAEGPVIITDRGTPSHVLLTVAEYQRILGKSKSVGSLLGNRKASKIDFDPPRVGTGSLTGSLKVPAFEST